MLWNVLQLILGLVVLVVGAELLIRGSSRFSAMLGLSKLLIGLTVVALGTSAPEIVVSVTAALQGKPDLTIGNVVAATFLTCSPSSASRLSSPPSPCRGAWCASTSPS
jgi:cation:H+ antiporter